MLERTLVIIKPDGLQRRLVGECIKRLEQKGLKIVAMKLIKATLKQSQELYSVHKGKTFYNWLIKFLTKAPIVVMVVEGEKAIDCVRKLLGATFGFDAEPGTIRGDFSMSKGQNIIHGSDSPESAQREIPIFFKPSEILSYKLIEEEFTI